MDKNQVEKQYSSRELSAFCLQISILLGAAVPLDEGLSIMAEDADSEEEKALLLRMSESVELGDPFYKAMEETHAFPPYVVRMAKLGQQTGTLDQMMESLSAYYEREFILVRNIKNAITYPVMMVFMLLVVLAVLFTRVMPVFEDVYEQLGAQISPAAQSAIRLGGVFSVCALALSGAAVVFLAVVWIFARFGRTFTAVERMREWIKGRNRIALAAANRRFASVLALTLKSGMELEKGMTLAVELVDNSRVAEHIRRCGEELASGTGYYQAMKDTGLFSSFHVQMIKVGTRSGRLDQVMEEISADYEEQADTAIDDMLARFEPTMVAVLAVAVGLILLSVMLPLAGVLAAVG